MGRDLPYYKFMWWDKIDWNQKDEAREFIRKVINQMPHVNFTINDFDFFEEKELCNQ